jgi:NAD(P)H-quinone oxidoreductase subunit 5
MPATLIELLPLAVPVLLLLAAFSTQPRAPAALWLNAAALGAALASAALVIAAGPNAALPGIVSPAAASHVVAVLVSFLGLVIGHFARRYLVGEHRVGRFVRLFQLTLAATAFTVLTDHLLVFFGGWVTISLALHQLLLFYPERPQAALAAHKKFLFARTAELALLGAALLLHSEHGTWTISEIAAACSDRGALSTSEQAAAVLLAVAALIKCAQLPVHGWLIQVVEAPTPVSALLHAGIINLGGYLMIVFAPLLSLAASAQWLLLIVAGLSFALASLVMTTRVSIKVKLAWSTVAQMGMMLVECALGLYELALLHLLAHGSYKSYQFLTAGSSVEKHLVSRLSPEKSPSAGEWIAAGLLVVPVVSTCALLLTPQGPFSPWLVAAGLLMACVAGRHSTTRRVPLAFGLACAAALLCAYVLQKAAIGGALDFPGGAVDPAADAWIILVFALMTTVWAALRTARESALTRRIHDWLFAGLYLDEWVSRMTLRLWPARLPVPKYPKRLPEFVREVE